MLLSSWSAAELLAAAVLLIEAFGTAASNAAACTAAAAAAAAVRVPGRTLRLVQAYSSLSFAKSTPCRSQTSIFLMHSVFLHSCSSPCRLWEPQVGFFLLPCCFRATQLFVRASDQACC
jgi:hypothetical protein